jgi:hypothetical protein
MSNMPGHWHFSRFCTALRGSIGERLRDVLRRWKNRSAKQGRMSATDAELRAMLTRVQWLQEASKEIRAAGVNETWAKVCDQGALDLASALGRLGFSNETGRTA